MTISISLVISLFGLFTCPCDSSCGSSSSSSGQLEGSEGKGI